MTAQPMDPKDVPATLVAQAEESALRYDRDCDAFEWDGYNRAILAAVVPAIRAAERARVADEIAETMWADPMGHWTADQADAARAMKQHIIRNITRGEDR